MAKPKLLYYPINYVLLTQLLVLITFTHFKPSLQALSLTQDSQYFMKIRHILNNLIQYYTKLQIQVLLYQDLYFMEQQIMQDLLHPLNSRSMLIT